MHVLDEPADARAKTDISTFELFINDERYSVPTLRLITAWSEDEALAIAQVVLRESYFHLAVELCLNGEILARFDPPARRQ